MMIAIWLVFAPTQAGGLASYIIVIGSSMEPDFHIGDLVVVHTEPAYQVGDAVAYRNQELQSFVFHRIIVQESGRYSLQGDNNSWIDTYQPSQQEMVGKLWLHIPKGGAFIQKMRSPINMAVTAGLLGGILALNFLIGKSKGRNRMKDGSMREWFAALMQKTRTWLAREKASSETSRPSSFLQGGVLEGSFFALGLIACASLFLGIMAFSRPAFRSTPDEIGYQHLGVFSYSGSAPQGVYDANRIKSGDPIFTRLTCSVDVDFQYSLLAGSAENIEGTYQLTAVLSEEVSGWQRSVPLQEEASFTGTIFGTTAKLDLCKMEGLTQSLEQGTDFHPGSYTLFITPNLKIHGEVAGRELQSAFDQGLTFKYDRVHFYLLRENAETNPLTLAEAGMLREDRLVPNTLLLFGMEVAVPALRTISSLCLIVSFTGITILGLKLQRFSSSDQQAFIHMKYGNVLIDIQPAVSLDNATLVDVTSMDDLAKLAERFHTVILHERRSDSHAYYVQTEGLAYRFVMADESGSAFLDPTQEAESQKGEA
jgi:signal peptidase I